MASITTFFGTQGGGGGGISGSGAAGEVAYFDSANSVDSNSALYWDTAGSGLVIGALAPAPGVAVARIQAYGISDAGGSLLALYAGNVWGNTSIMRLSEKGTLYLSSNAGTGGLTENVFIGDSAIGQNATSTALINVAIGHPSAVLASGPPGGSLTTGDNNVLVGASAGANINTGSANIGVGGGALQFLTSGNGNVSVGVIAGKSLTTGSSNSFFGYFSGREATTSDSNSAIGVGSLLNVVSTGENTAAGVYAGAFKGTSTTANADCSQCVYLGGFTRSKSSGTPTNEIVIGYNATGNGSNSVTLGHTTITDTYLRGDIHLESSPSIYFSTVTGTSIGSAPTEKFSFYGVAPIVQPDNLITSATVVHGSGQAVKDDSTFGGYTIGQIVKALQTLGLLA